MIELPRSPAPADFEHQMLDFGSTNRPSGGGAVTRYDRKGSRFALQINYPPMEPALSRIFVSRLLEAKSAGVRIPLPLIDGPQGAPGSPVVDGAGQSGVTLNLRGLTEGYAAKEGYWLSIEDADGQHYLHNCRSNMRSVGGDGTMRIWPELRVPFADGAKVHLAKPMVEGLPQGDSVSWTFPVNKLIALSFNLEESA